jgi:hypothetical protein
MICKDCLCGKKCSLFAPAVCSALEHMSWHGHKPLFSQPVALKDYRCDANHKPIVFWFGHLGQWDNCALISIPTYILTYVALPT